MHLSTLSFFGSLELEWFKSKLDAIGLYGMVTIKVEPSPFIDLTRIFPPNNFVFSLAIDKPKPNPSLFSDNSIASLANRLKTDACLSFLIPMPVS